MSQEIRVRFWSIWSQSEGRQSYRTSQCSQVTVLDDSRLRHPTHLFGWKASRPTKLYFFEASTASCLSRRATYSSSSMLSPAMVEAFVNVALKGSRGLGGRIDNRSTEAPALAFGLYSPKPPFRVFLNKQREHSRPRNNTDCKPNVVRWTASTSRGQIPLQMRSSSWNNHNRSNYSPSQRPYRQKTTPNLRKNASLAFQTTANRMETRTRQLCKRISCITRYRISCKQDRSAI